MAVEECEMWEYMDSCNGEIRVMPGRYGGGWLAAGCAVTEWDFDMPWQDLVGGDNDYSSARNFFNDNQDTILIECADSAREAFDLCVSGLSNAITIP